jgi:hypothetical protein
VADAILAAADRAPREVFVALPTAQAVIGQRLAPGLLDRYLASAGWEPQFVDAPNQQSGDILFETLPGDPGAHGPYRDRETGPDLLMRMSRVDVPMAAAGAFALLTGVAAALLWRKR